eukprot:NODE_3689_length_919_cov_16.191919_g3537_i0.p2 GENE.NODE_3689_length_919_cov_16.191919_g3537_i0~~NODE_3689_length_919_cov_16.191919_g3537_i0.p2  ORF type:complete len:247 (+),score=62.77 NODE_3689_length_919_cov_16.191919_g3537_i0:111-851(+)
MQPQHDVSHLFTLHPLECALVIRQTIIIGACTVACFVGHAVYLLTTTWDSPAFPDQCFRWALFLRLLMALPRPFLWVQMYHLYSTAFNQPTPALITQSLITAYHHPTMKLNARFSKLFYIWLGMTVVGTFLFYTEGPLAHQLYRHCFWQLVVLALIKLFSLLSFFWLTQADLDRGTNRLPLDSFTEVLPFPEGSESKTCCICLSEFVAPEPVRRLRCMHVFHPVCVDRWLRKYSASCPLCKRDASS